MFVVDRYLLVSDSQVAWDRRRTLSGLGTGPTGHFCPSSSMISCAGSDVMLRPPTPNYCASGDDDNDSVNQLQFGGTTGSPPMSPGGASIAPDGRFRFRYNRSFTFRRGTSTSSSGGTGNGGSRRSSTSPDKGRRAVQVRDAVADGVDDDDDVVCLST